MGRRAGGAALTGGWGDLWRADVLDTARGLLGCRVTAGGVTVRLTEVEAYRGLGVDPASHAFRGPTRRNAPMFAGPGLAYVYFVFGMHWCLNITCAEPGSAILVRAGEVVDGLDLAQARAGSGSGSGAGGAFAGRELARGPGRLARALGVDGTASGTPLLDGTGPVLLTPAAERVDPAAIEAGPRVGVAAAAELPWRFWLRGEPTVSGYRRHVPRRRPRVPDTDL